MMGGEGKNGTIRKTEALARKKERLFDAAADLPLNFSWNMNNSWKYFTFESFLSVQEDELL